MQKKPNPFIHMTIYGVTYGLVLAFIYIFIIGFIFALWSGMMGWLFIYALGFGALPGLVFGLIEGGLLWYLTRHVTPTMKAESLAILRKRILRIIAAVTFVGGATLGFVVFSFRLTFITDVIPAAIATIAATFAAHRYMRKLRHWHEGSEKSKRTSDTHSTHNIMSEDDT